MEGVAGIMRFGSTKIVLVILPIFTIAIALDGAAQSGNVRINGTVLDPVGRTESGARVEFDSVSGARLSATTGSDGSFTISLPVWGNYTAHVSASGFADVTRNLELSPPATPITLQLERVAGVSQEVIVLAGVAAIAIATPDPSQKVMVREELHRHTTAR